MFFFFFCLLAFFPAGWWLRGDERTMVGWWLLTMVRSALLCVCRIQALDREMLQRYESQHTEYSSDG
jgi:hypothetical protein